MGYPLLLQAPGLVALALLAAVIVATRTRARAVLRILAPATLLYWWIATPLGANVMVGALEHSASVTAACPAPAAGDVIVVLAGGIDAPDESPARSFERLHEATLHRVFAAVELARANPSLPVVMSGGQGGDVREADLMRDLAAAMGLEPGRIAVDRASMNTYESGVTVARLERAREGAARTVRLVTSALHMPRAMAVFRAAGLRPCPHAIDRRWVSPPWSHALFPQISALRKSTDALHEAVGLAAYKLLGRT